MSHLIALMASVVVSGMLGGLGYAIFLVVALFTGGGIGGPLNLALVPLLVALTVGLVTVVLVLPARLVFAAISTRWPAAAVPCRLAALAGAGVILWYAWPLFSRAVTPTENVVRLSAVAAVVAVPTYILYAIMLRVSGLIVLCVRYFTTPDTEEQLPAQQR